MSDYTRQRIFYRSIQHDDGVIHDRLTIHDYLWRWDTDWFWCSEGFGAQHPLIRPLWHRRYRRSSSYWKLMRLARRYGIGDELERLKRRPPREWVIQDIEVPIARTVEFLDWFLANVPIEPIWLCPIRPRSDDGWRVEVEVLEVRRITDTTDVLATSELTLDEDGDIEGYRRLHHIQFRESA